MTWGRGAWVCIQEEEGTSRQRRRMKMHEKAGMGNGEARERCRYGSVAGGRGRGPAGVHGRTARGDE